MAGTAHTHDMATTPSSRLLRRNVPVTHSDALFAFLVPSVQLVRNAPRACFSTSPARWKRDNNKNRGNSAIRATGLRPRQTLSVRDKDFEKQKLPKPVKVEEKATGTPDHGLWDFFKDKQLLQTPVVEQRHGSRQFVHIIHGLAGLTETQGDRGLSASCAIGTGTHCTSCGGYV